MTAKYRTVLPLTHSPTHRTPFTSQGVCASGSVQVQPAKPVYSLTVVGPVKAGKTNFVDALLHCAKIEGMPEKRRSPADGYYQTQQDFKGGVPFTLMPQDGGATHDLNLHECESLE